MKHRIGTLIISLLVFVSASHAQELKIYRELFDKYCISGKIYYDDQEVCIFTEQPNSKTGTISPGTYDATMIPAMLGDGWALGLRDEQDNIHNIFVFKFMDEFGEKMTDEIVLFIGASVINCKIWDEDTGYEKVQEIFEKAPPFKVFDKEDSTIKILKVTIENDVKVDKKISKIKK
jgi:hypothetical protein